MVPQTPNLYHCEAQELLYPNSSLRNLNLFLSMPSVCVSRFIVFVVSSLRTYTLQLALLQPTFKLLTSEVIISIFLLTQLL